MLRTSLGCQAALHFGALLTVSIGTSACVGNQVKSGVDPSTGLVADTVTFEAIVRSVQPAAGQVFRVDPRPFLSDSGTVSVQDARVRADTMGLGARLRVLARRGVDVADASVFSSCTNAVAAPGEDMPSVGCPAVRTLVVMVGRSRPTLPPGTYDRAGQPRDARSRQTVRMIETNAAPTAATAIAYDVLVGWTNQRWQVLSRRPVFFDG